MKRNIHCICIMCFLTLVGITDNAQSKLAENNKIIALHWLSAWSTHDSVKVASFYAEPFMHEDMAFIYKFSTKDQVVRFVHGTVKGIPDLKFTPTAAFASDSMAMVEWTWEGTFSVGWPPKYPGTNKTFSIRGVTIMEIKNGLIKRSSDYYNKNSLLKAVGLQ